MRPYPRTVSNLFEGKWRYQIPLFQRQYVWDRDRQWLPLWVDIETKAGEGQPDATAPKRPHFLGAIVFKPQTPYGDQVPTREVIDGQQRLTTLQIILAAMRDVAVELSITKYSQELADYTRNAGEMERPDEERFKVSPTDGDLDVFKSIMDAGSRQAVETLYPQTYARRKPLQRHRIVEAYLFFHNAILGFLSTDETGRTERFSSLFRTLTQQLQLVSLELEDGDDPQVIFETLNYRGEPLLASDLLRNYIFVRADRAGEDYRQLYARYWRPFDVLVSPDSTTKHERFFWKVKEKQGRLTRPRLDLFFQHFLSMNRALTDGNEDLVQIGHLYQEYQDWIKHTKPYPTVEAEIADLTSKADVFKGFFAPDDQTHVGRFAARLKALDTSTVYPLLLFLSTSETVDQQSLEGIVIDLESFLVRRLICARTTKNYNRLFLQMLRLAVEHPRLTRPAFRSILLQGQGDAVDWPSNEDFKEAWLYKEAYEFLRPRRVEMILRAINDALTTDLTEKGIALRTLHIEHVMPQSWQAFWAAPTARPGESPAETLARRTRNIHSLGNLTLLTQKLNQTVSNGPYHDKRSRITENSALRLNAYFQTQDFWDDDTILRRGEALFEIAKEVWPRPA
jgi:hypothetical protein